MHGILISYSLLLFIIINIVLKSRYVVITIFVLFTGWCHHSLDINRIQRLIEPYFMVFLFHTTSFNLLNIRHKLGRDHFFTIFSNSKHHPWCDLINTAPSLRYFFSTVTLNQYDSTTTDTPRCDSRTTTPPQSFKLSSSLILSYNMNREH